MLPSFTVIDSLTGEYPNYEKIAREESWASGLIWCDIEGLALLEHGSLVLLDECGGYAFPPEGRFLINVS